MTSATQNTLIAGILLVLAYVYSAIGTFLAPLVLTQLSLALSLGFVLFIGSSIVAGGLIWLLVHQPTTQS